MYYKKGPSGCLMPDATHLTAEGSAVAGSRRDCSKWPCRKLYVRGRSWLINKDPIGQAGKAVCQVPPEHTATSSA
jgi:hypothetical protein